MSDNRYSNLCNRWRTKFARKLVLMTIPAVVMLVVLIPWEFATSTTRIEILYKAALNVPNAVSKCGPSDQHRRQLIAALKERTDGCLYLQETTRALKEMSDGATSLPDCPEKNPSFSPEPNNNRHLTALASYPGSGNTWTRHLIEYISDETPKLASHLNDTHGLPGEDHTAYDNAILIVRHPRDAVLSDYNLIRKGNKTASVEQVEFKTTRWASHVTECTKAWETMNLKWLREYRGRLMVLSYTRLNEEFYGELCRLGGFLNVTISSDKLRCSFEKREGKYHRKSTIDKSSIYTAVMLDAMNRAERKVKAAIAERFGYDATRGLF